MSDLLLVALVAGTPGLLAVFLIWDAREETQAVNKRMAHFGERFDVVTAQLLDKTQEVARLAGIAAQMKVGAEEAARVAVAVAEVVAVKAHEDQAAAELRTPQESPVELVREEVKAQVEFAESKRIAKATEDLVTETARVAAAAEATVPVANGAKTEGG